MKKAMLILIMLTFLFTGCRDNDLDAVTSNADQFHLDEFSNILVMFPVGDLKLRQDVEGIIYEKLKKENIKAHKGYELLPMIDLYSDKELEYRMSFAIEQNNIDSIAFITLDNVYSDQEKLDVDTSGMQQGFSKGFAEGLDDTYINSLSFNFGIRLLNTKTGGYGWYGVIKAQDTSYGGTPDITKAISNSVKPIIEKMIKEGIITQEKEGVVI